MQARAFAPVVPFLAFAALVHCGSSSSAVAPGAPPIVADSGPAEASAPIVEPPDAGADAALPDAAPALAPMTTSRSLFAAINGKDGRIRSLGGLTPKGLDDSAEAYDPVANTWTPATSHASVRRYGHAATQDAEGHVVVLGGTSNGTNPIASVEMFSPADDSWTQLEDLPTARLGLGAATGKDGRIYAIGGRDASGAPTTVVEIYSPATHSWSTGPSLTTARLSLVAVTGADGKIYAIGGRDAKAVPLAVVEALDVDSGTWSTVQPLLTPRYWFGATLGADGRIFALGGLDDLGFIDAIEAFTPGSGWTSLGTMPEARGWVSAAASPDGRVFAIGGSTPQDDVLAGMQPPPMKTMLAFDPKTGTWQK